MERLSQIVGVVVLSAAAFAGLFQFAWWVLDRVWWQRLCQFRKAAYFAAFGNTEAEQLARLKRSVLLEYPYVGESQCPYYLAHLVQALVDQEDTGDWKSDLLDALANEADRLDLTMLETNSARCFVRDDTAGAGTYGWREQ